MRRDEFFTDAKARGKTQEEALAGADRYFEMYGDFDPPKQEFRPDKILSENVTDGMSEEDKNAFQQVSTPADNSRFLAQRYYELKDSKDYSDKFLLDQRVRQDMGIDSTNAVDYVSTVKYLTDVTKPYAKMQEERASAGDIAKGTASSFIETGANIPKGIQGALDIYITQMGGGDIPEEIQSAQIWKNKETGEDVVWNPNTEETAFPPTDTDFRKKHKFIGHKQIEIGRKERGLKRLTGKYSDKISASIDGINPESWKRSREIMQIEAGRELKGNVLEKTLQGAKQGLMLVADNAPNLVASRANPAFGYMVMFSNEKESMYQTLVDAGIDKAIAEDASLMYGNVSAPIEYIENAGRLTAAFGKKKAVSKGSKLVRRVIKDRLKEAGINIAEELTQEGLFNVIYNSAVKSNNEKYGTTIENKSMTLEDAMKTAKASLQMSAVLDALGIPVKFTQKRSDIKNNTEKLMDAGFTEIDANKYANDIANADSQDELDAIHLEMQGQAEKIETANAEARDERTEKFKQPQELTLEPIPKTDMISGGDGTPLTSGDFNTIRENYTDDQINEKAEDEWKDTFIKAINGDANAQAEYNRLLIEDQTIDQEATDDGEVAQSEISESNATDEFLNAAKEIVSQEVLPLVEDIEQDYVKARLDNIIDTMTVEDAQTELKRLHEAYPELPKSVDKYIIDAVNVRGEQIAEEKVADVVEPIIEAEKQEAPVVERTAKEQQAVDEFIPKEEQATPKDIKETAELRGEDDVYLRKADIERIRESEQYEKLPPSQKIEWQTHLDNAKKLGLDLEAIELANRIIKKPRVITPQEHASLVLRSTQLFNSIDDKLEEIERAIAQGKNADDLKEHLDQMHTALDKITRASDLSGTEAGRALNIRKLGIERETYELAEVVRRASAMKGQPLTDKELTSLSGVVKQLEEWDAKAEKLVADLEAMDSKSNKDLANEVVLAEIDSLQGTRDIAKLKADEKKIKEQLRKMGYRMNDITGITVEGSELIAKLAINYIKQGEANLDAVVNRVQKVMPDASPQNVFDALSGRHKSVIQRVRTESAKRLSELKTQSTLRSKIIDAHEGIFTKSGIKRPSSPEVRKLLKELRELQKTAENTEQVDAKLQKINDAIGRVERDIQESNFPKKKQLIPENERVKEAKQNLSELKRLLKTNEEVADLERRIKEKDYEGLFNPRTVKAIKSKELQDAMLKKHQLKREIRNRMQAMRKKTAKDYVAGTADALRAIRATADMSYFLRQGLIPSLGHPILASKAFKNSVTAFFNKDKADLIDMALKADEMQLQRDKYGLYLADLDEAMNHGEEMFSSEVVKKIPILGKVAEASERNMVVGLNMLRAGLFDDFIKKNPEASEESKRAYAKYINTVTGRTDWHGFTDSVWAKNILFSPKFTASRMEAIPRAAYTAIKHKETRKEIARQWSALVGTGLTILALAKMAGADVGDDPDEPDFGKIVVNGKVRVDVWGGLQQPVRLFLRLAKSGTEDSKDSFADISMQFFKYKAAPAVTAFVETYTGKDWVTNQDINRASNLAMQATPLIFESAIEGFKEELTFEESVLALGGEFFGLGVQAYKKKKKKSKSSVWN